MLIKCWNESPINPLFNSNLNSFESKYIQINHILFQIKNSVQFQSYYLIQKPFNSRNLRLKPIPREWLKRRSFSQFSVKLVYDLIIWMNINTNSVFELISVILSSFVSKCESKRFCETFQENNYKIDYSIEYYPYLYHGTSPAHIMHLLVVIGNDYWVIEMLRPKPDNLKLVSNQSRSDEELGRNYSAAFLIHIVHDNKTNIVGFIHVR